MKLTPKKNIHELWAMAEKKMIAGKVPTEIIKITKRGFYLGASAMSSIILSDFMSWNMEQERLLEERWKK